MWGGGDFNYYIVSDVCWYRTFSVAHLEKGVCASAMPSLRLAHVLPLHVLVCAL